MHSARPTAPLSPSPLDGPPRAAAERGLPSRARLWPLVRRGRLPLAVAAPAPLFIYILRKNTHTQKSPLTSASPNVFYTSQLDCLERRSAILQPMQRVYTIERPFGHSFWAARLLLARREARARALLAAALYSSVRAARC